MSGQPKWVPGTLLRLKEDFDIWCIPAGADIDETPRNPQPYKAGTTAIVAHMRDDYFILRIIGGADVDCPWCPDSIRAFWKVVRTPKKEK